MFVVLFVSPFMRGLFFPVELLPVQAGIGVAFIFCVYDQILRREALRLQTLDLAVLGMVIAYAVSLLTAVHLRPAVGELLEMTAALMVYWMAARACTGRAALDGMLAVIFAAAVGVALIGFLAAAQVFPFPGAYVNGVITSTLQYKNALAVYLGAASLIGLGLSVKAEHLWPKLLLAAGNALCIVVILGTMSRGGWLLYPLAAAACVALLPGSLRWRAVYHLVIPAGAALILSRPIFAAFGGDEPALALPYLGSVLLSAVMLQGGYHYLARWLNRPEVAENTRRLVAAGGLVYCLFIGLIYLWYAGAAYPTAAAGIVPGKVVQQAAKISGAEPSFQARLEYSRDALKIVRDHPLSGAGGGGWNALYHQYQDKEYFTTEVHNHFMQVWVETGTLGFLAFLSVWVFFALTFLRVRRHTPPGDQPASLTALAVAIFLLGVHSAFDFDLSLPALGFLLYAGMGAVRGAAMNMGGYGYQSPEGPVKRKQPAKDEAAPAQPGCARTGSLALLAVAGTVLALALIIPSCRFYQGGVEGAKGARAILEGDLDKARTHLEEARRLDPFTASYAVDLAQVYAVGAVSKRDVNERDLALAEARAAARLAPYDPQVSGALVNVYGLVNEHELAVSEARRILEANPVFEPNYVMFGRVLIGAAVNSLRDRQFDRAAAYLGEAERLPTRLEARRKSAGIPAGLVLVLGQAAYLRGDLASAREHLAIAAKDPETAQEARLWQAVVLARLGEETKARQLVTELSRKDPAVRQVYEELRGLPTMRQ
ncbi:O-antigen ligase family protein [Desulforudis sp. DRI-14]